MRCKRVRSFTNCSTTTRLRRNGWVLTTDDLSARVSLLESADNMGTETKPEYSPGLAGVIAGETAICWVDPAAGLMYRGYDIHQTGVSMLSPFDKDLNDHSHDANIRKSIRLIARVSTLITDGWRISRGEQPLPEKPQLTQAANFFYKFNGKIPEQWQTRMLDTIFNLYADHEFNASTFAARVTASTLAGIYAAVTSAVATLKGPLHGGANEESMKMLEEIGAPDRAEAWLMKKLGTKDKIMGFGHRVYKKGDSRVPAMREIARDLGKRTGKENWVPICEKLEQMMDREKQLCANVDLYAAPVFWMLGFPPELNTPLFAASRVAGWCAHVIEQHDNNRLIRPRSLYVGPELRPYPGSPK